MAAPHEEEKIDVNDKAPIQVVSDSETPEYDEYISLDQIYQGKDLKVLTVSLFEVIGDKHTRLCSHSARLTTMSSQSSFSSTCCLILIEAMSETPVSSVPKPTLAYLVPSGTSGWL